MPVHARRRIVVEKMMSYTWFLRPGIAVIPTFLGKRNPGFLRYESEGLDPGRGAIAGKYHAPLAVWHEGQVPTIRNEL